MKIDTIKLKNYRNHVNATFDFDDKLTLIVGNNGTGKTNILEAIHLISTSKSQRARYDRDLINYDHTFCTISANILPDGEKEHMELQIIKNPNFEHSSSKKVKINKTPKALFNFCGTFLSVLFTPEDLDQLNNSPSARRKYLDMVLFQTHKDYKKKHSQYTHAVKVRNKLLEQIRDFGTQKDQLTYWNEQILNLGRYIQECRDEFFAFLKQNLPIKGQELNRKKDGLDVNYLKNEMSTIRLQKYEEREILSKSTLIGPHRDDFEIMSQEKNIAYFGSRGQQRTSLLALKLCEIDFIELKKRVRPVLLLDDIFSELDESHKETVLGCILNQQTIITSTELPPFLKTNAVIRL